MNQAERKERIQHFVYLGLRFLITCSSRSMMTALSLLACIQGLLACMDLIQKTCVCFVLQILGTIGNKT
jgi:hypothetical protein